MEIQHDHPVETLHSAVLHCSVGTHLDPGKTKNYKYGASPHLRSKEVMVAWHNQNTTWQGEAGSNPPQGRLFREGSRAPRDEEQISSRAGGLVPPVTRADPDNRSWHWF